MILFARTLIALTLIAGVLCSSLSVMATTATTRASKDKTSKKSKKKKTKFHYKFATQSRFLGYEEGVEEAQLMQLRLIPEVRFRLSPWFRVAARGTLNLNSGRIQSRFADNSTNSLSLDKLEAVLKPWAGPFYLKGGAIDQSFLRSDLLIDKPRSFPGAVVGLTHRWKHFAFNLSGQQALPTSVSLESDRREDEEKARFTTYGVAAKFRPVKEIIFKASVYQFEFRDLPSVVAKESGFLGNEVNDNNGPDSFFLYDFKGLAHSYEAKLKISDWFRPFAEMQIVENKSAPDVSNRAQLIGGGMHFKFKDFGITPFAASFYSEANSSPAVYNSAVLGHNNREGMFYKLKTDFTKYGFFVEAQYAQANLIDPHEIQEDMNFFALTIGIANVLF